VLQLDFAFDDQLAIRTAEARGSVARDAAVDAALAGNAPVYVASAAARTARHWPTAFRPISMISAMSGRGR